ncbi:MAG: tRNA (adenosine(37)-N6)-threonylcarbamoyltransferase complex dimerization subunit type 1 TsaB, partial [bacterium]
MKLLAIDTATETCGIALAEGEQLLADFRLNKKNIHNEKLVSGIQGLLQNVGWGLEDLAGIVFSKGPGSFTGLRIGLSVTKGLAYSVGIPMVGINTLDALAYGAPCWQGSVCAVIKAREREAYFAVYQKVREGVNRTTDYAIAPLETVAEKLQDGLLVVSNPPDLLDEHLKKRFVVAAPEYSFLQPHMVAILGYQKLKLGETDDPESVEPFY